MTPRTAAGRYLRDRLRTIHSLSSSDIDKDIAAIEAEAAATAREELALLGDSLDAARAEADRSLLLDAALRALVEAFDAWHGGNPLSPKAQEAAWVAFLVTLDAARAALAATDAAKGVER